MKRPETISLIMMCGMLLLTPAGAKNKAGEEMKAGTVAKSGGQKVDDQKHPFLASKRLPAWSQMTPDKLEADIQLGIELARQDVAKICAVKPEEATYANTFGTMDKMGRELGWAQGRMSTLESLKDSPELREVGKKVRPLLTGFFASIQLNPQLYSVLSKYAEGALGDAKKASELTAVQKRYINETLKEFRKSGAQLKDSDKVKLVEMQKRHQELTQSYTQNVMDSTNAWELYVSDPELLKGIPERFLIGAHEEAKAKGKEKDAEGRKQYRITLQPTSFPVVLQYADSPELRKQVWEAANSIGSGEKYDNEKLVWEILKVRADIAQILGFKNFAEMTTSDRMAENSATVFEFLDSLHRQSVDQFRKDMEALRAFQEKQTGKKVEKLAPWDTGYWAEKMRKAEYDFDGEQLRPYYQLDKAMGGLFGLVQKLYDIKIEPLKAAFLKPGEKLPEGAVEVWHPDVEVFRVTDNKTGKMLGTFYTDWYPRESKRGGAWMSPLDPGVAAAPGQEGEPHVAMICGNLSKPIGGKPALISHRELETVFHEFGHLMHVMLSDVPVRTLGGTSVAWDFVELPSQIMENWTWERAGLDLFAKHYETGEAIPDELFAKMIKARNFMSSSQMIRQLGLARMDMMLHEHPEKYLGKDIEDADLEMTAEYRVPMEVDGQSILRKITHLFGRTSGYPAGYYSYKWAEALEADAFTRFQKEGLTNPEVGSAFRKEILSRGDSVPAEELFRNFMGRKPDPDALLKRSGLK